MFDHEVDEFHTRLRETTSISTLSHSSSTSMFLGSLVATFLMLKLGDI